MSFLCLQTSVNLNQDIGIAIKTAKQSHLFYKNKLLVISLFSESYTVRKEIKMKHSINCVLPP